MTIVHPERVAAADPLIIPGVYDIPDEVYHRDPVPGGSLSSSGARKLLPPSCPAVFRHEQLNPRAPKKEFDFGHAAHKLVLGAGPKLAVVDADDWRTNDAKQQRAAAYAADAVPLLRAEYEQVLAMADVLRQHPIAAALFNPERGDPEQTLIWQDRLSGVWLRARLDWLPHSGGGRMIVPDYKTARSASPDAIQKTVHQYGYHQQAAWYIDGVRALGLANDAAFVFVCQEKTAPYLVTVVELNPMALRVARDLNRQAIETYRICCETGRWPGYSDEIELISLPAWAENRYLQETS